MASHSPTAAASQQTPSQPESRGLGVNITGRNISIWLIGSVAILLIGMAVALFDLWFQSFYYAATDNSFVEGAYVQIASPGAAQVSTLDVRQGEQVTEGQAVATVRIFGGSSSSASQVIHHLKAPRDGVVVSVPVREGQLLTAGQAVMMLTDPDSLWIVANLDETSLKGVQVGQSAEIQITVLDLTCQGQVAEVLPDYAPANGTTQTRSRTTSTLVPVRVDFVGGCPGVYPGMSAYTRIKIR